MSSYKDREQGFERKFVHDEEMQFKITARRNKLLGLWAAEKMGKSGNAADQYAKDVVMSDFESNEHDDVVQKLLNDFSHAKIAMTATDILRIMEALTPKARQMVMDEHKPK